MTNIGFTFPTVWIRKLRCVDIRSFEDSGEIELSKSINLFFGHNNSGKSTLLRALGFMQLPDWLGASDWRKGANEKGTAFITIADLTEQNRLQIQPEQLLQDMNGDVLTRVDLGAGGFSGFSGPAPSATLGIPTIPNEYPKNFVFPFSDLRRQTAPDQTIHSGVSNEVRKDHGRLNAYVDLLTQTEHPNHAEYVSECERILGARFGSYASQHGKSAGLYTRDKSYLVSSGMGAGTDQLLNFIVCLCLADHNLFLIEDIETDLHPKALKALLDLVQRKSETNQFAITTHSNIVLRQLGAEPSTHIFRCDMEIKDRLPTSTVTRVESLQDRRQLLEDLGYQLFDFGFHEKWLILEESSAERIIRDYLIPWFVPSLIGRIRTIAANGVDDVEPQFNEFRRLFTFLHLENVYKGRAWVVVDGDEPGKAVVVKLQAKFGDWSANAFSFVEKEAFELYYPAEFQERAKDTLEEADKKERRNKKKKLLEDVVDWIKRDEENAKHQFATSAAEWVEKLKAIATAGESNP
ncbi:MAG: AAA family ATPase [Fimbriimonadaceae bacterium]